MSSLDIKLPQEHQFKSFAANASFLNNSRSLADTSAEGHHQFMNHMKTETCSRLSEGQSSIQNHPLAKPIAP